MKYFYTKFLFVIILFCITSIVVSAANNPYAGMFGAERVQGEEKARRDLCAMQVARRMALGLPIAAPATAPTSKNIVLNKAIIDQLSDSIKGARQSIEAVQKQLNEIIAASGQAGVPVARQDASVQQQQVRTQQEMDADRIVQSAMNGSLAVLPGVVIPVARQHASVQQQQVRTPQEMDADSIVHSAMNGSPAVLPRVGISTARQDAQQPRSQPVLAPRAGTKKRKRSEAPSARNVCGRVPDSVPFDPAAHFSNNSLSLPLGQPHKAARG